MSTDTIKDLSILELIKNFRIIKRQIKIIKALNLSSLEKNKIKKAIMELENDLNVFKL